MRVATSLCVCGHSLGYHRKIMVSGMGELEVCDVWGCGCDEYEVETDE